MNYLKAYENLIKLHGSKQKPFGYSERHHILPKCMGGSDDKDNLVYLSARTHYLAHGLLFYHYKSVKLARAWFGMCDTHRMSNRRVTARQYSLAKKAFSEFNHMKEGEHRKRASVVAKEQWSQNYEEMKKSNSHIFKDSSHGMFMKGKTGFKHPRGRSVITPLGTFGSVREAAKAHNIRHPAISKKCKNPAIPNYRYADGNNHPIEQIG